MEKPVGEDGESDFTGQPCQHVCESHHFNLDQCWSIIGCAYNEPDQKCMSAVGPNVCPPGQRLGIADGLIEWGCSRPPVNTTGLKMKEVIDAEIERDTWCEDEKNYQA